MGAFPGILIFIFAFSFVFAKPTPQSYTYDTPEPSKVEFPHYLVPAKQAYPNTAFPTQYTGNVSYTPSAGNEVILYVGFDVPNIDAPVCVIKFRLPSKDTDPDGYPWVVSGNGRLDVFLLIEKIVPGQLTWNNKPARSSNSPIVKIIQPRAGGDATIIGGSFPCKTGQRMDFEVTITRPGPGTFYWFELDSPQSGITLEMYSEEASEAWKF